MTLNEALNKITVMLGLNTETVVTTEVTEEKFADAELVDGTSVMTEGELVEGAVLYVVTEEGNVLAPEGMHETTTGLIITVGAEGVIVSIEEKAAEEAPSVDVEVEVPMVPVNEETPVTLSEDVVSSIVNAIKPALEEIQSLKNDLATLQANFSAFKDEPAGKKITNNLVEYKQTEENFSDARFQQLKKIRHGK
jgi:hypothetical protein